MMRLSVNEVELVVYIDGKFYPESQAKIPVFDHAVLYGDAVYDTCCAWAGSIFKLDQHIDRLFESAQGIGLQVPVNKEDIKKATLETVRRNGLKDAYVKIIVTRGVGDVPLLTPINCKPSVIIFAKPYQRVVDVEGREGISVKVSSIRKIPPECLDPKIKSCNYLNHVLMFLDAKQSGADSAIELGTDGYVAEAPGYNVFIVKKGTLYTPAENILVGITRQTVLEIATQEETPVVEGRLTTFDLYNADEIFFSSTAGGIIPVVKVDGKLIGNGKPGPITEKIRRRYRNLLESGEKSTAVY